MYIYKYSEDEGATFLRNAGNYLQDNTAKQARTLQSSVIRSSSL
jgi:hypothetical protein